MKSFGYDGAGRRTSATYSGITTTYSYDYESRITGITRTGTTANSFAYNGFDTRVSKTDSSGTTSYKRAGAGVTSSLLKSTVSSTTTDYTPGVSSRVSDDSTFMHSGIKNADEQTDQNGDISARRQYDAFGNLVSSNGPWAGPFGYGGPYGYQTDSDHGLMLLGHRYYESDTGRFLTRDPIKHSRNWYGYCGGSPQARADPRGLRWWWFSSWRGQLTNDLPQGSVFDVWYLADAHENLSGSNPLGVPSPLRPGRTAPGQTTDDSEDVDYVIVVNRRTGETRVYKVGGGMNAGHVTVEEGSRGGFKIVRYRDRILPGQKNPYGGIPYSNLIQEILPYYRDPWVRARIRGGGLVSPKQ